MVISTQHASFALTRHAQGGDFRALGATVHENSVCNNTRLRHARIVMSIERDVLTDSACS
jgi:hypothetical protein